MDVYAKFEPHTLSQYYESHDNDSKDLRRAIKIFSVEPEQFQIWDFSSTMMLFLNDRNKILNDYSRRSEHYMPLQLHVYELSEPNENIWVRNYASPFQLPYRDSVMMNGSPAQRSGGAGTPGLTGLRNLGNTCFMNSALQCLVHTPKIVDYFLGDYEKELNHDNPLGTNGEIALEFGDLLKRLWESEGYPVAPRTFKSKISHFAPQFSGYNQHDSQELLAFLLDGLHEDLNRVKCKPYVEVKDDDDLPDEEVADEYWQNHLARNDSIIVDLCQGQYKSTLVCPDCRKAKVTFDPFMYLSLPLPSTSVRTMTLTVMKSDDVSPPLAFTVIVPSNGRLEHLTEAISIACSLRQDESILLAEIYNNRIIRYLDDPSEFLTVIRDDDQLVAYRLPSYYKKESLVVFMSEEIERKTIWGKFMSTWKRFGVPLVAHRKIVNGSDIRDLYCKLLEPYLVPIEGSVNEIYNGGSATTEISEVAEEANTLRLSGCIDKADAEVVKVQYEDWFKICKTDKDSVNEFDYRERTTTEILMVGEEASTSTHTCCTGKADFDEVKAHSGTGFQFFCKDGKSTARIAEIMMNEPVKCTTISGPLKVLVRWSDKMSESYNMRPFRLLPEVCKSDSYRPRREEHTSLYKCLEAFLTKEPLGPDDMWYCPICKKHCQASKKLDLWRLPEILVIHLKRFSYSRLFNHKLETFVDFPVNDLDLSSYIAHKDSESSHHYKLYAISNHFGSMGGGHYTAFVQHDGKQWYDFNDSDVSKIDKDIIKSSAAYVLFYRRVKD
ncbi:cysteine protease [Lithospermum erythrorhizon]|uniref:Ubiquitin carboxyl-terminal hydrolase n=1 Tax=Lithospermum erythrorhizon TaxID=34254 RepID=A0AAV3QLP3_LITER